MRILVTGGAGYIGSHTCVELIKEHNPEAVIVTTPWEELDGKELAALLAHKKA